MKVCLLTLMLFAVTSMSVNAVQAKQTQAAKVTPETLAPQLEVLRPYLNKVWRGELQAQQPGKTSIDISLWQRALNGQAIKVLHSINDGEYGGESIIFWDKSKKSLAYYYFTTGGFYTHGVMKYDEVSQALVAEEQVENNANGITKVRSTTALKGGHLITNAEYLQQGQWVKGHSATYSESKDGQVRFK